MKYFSRWVLIFLILCCNNSTLLAQKQEEKKYRLDDLVEMELAEILNVKIAIGNLSKIETKKIPAVITTITKEQIENSQARNLASLLEVYVPGMVLMVHSEGEKIGIRGAIAAENYKLLLLINGINITNMVYEGVITEIDMWDMNDIERIEVIRGPGSVTYGSGAVAGVINIVTKKADDNKYSMNVGGQYFPQYRSKSAHLQFSNQFNDVGILAYGSISKTQGQANPNYHIMNGDTLNDNRFLGKEIGSTAQAQDYLSDGLFRPQLKAHLDVNYKGNLRIVTRYTQSGQTHHMTRKTNIEDNLGVVIDSKNRRHVGIRSFLFAPKYTINFSEKAQLLISSKYSDQEYIRYDFRNTEFEWDDANNIRDYAFSQKVINARFLLKYDPGAWLNLVIGPEINYTYVSAPWGKSMDHFMIREGVFIINDTLTSVYYTDPDSQLNKNNGVDEAGDGIKVFTGSLLFESTMKLMKPLTLMISARVDKPSISKTMFSPRLALITEINDNNTLKLFVQNSNRMMPLRFQYLFDKYRTTEKYKIETIQGVELAFTRVHKKNVLLSTNIYYNKLNAVGFTGKDLRLIGEQKQFGFDIEAKYSNKNTEIGANHAYLKLIDFDQNDELKDGTNRNNITFSDYNYDVNRNGYTLELRDYGNDLNNWINNSTRLFVTQKLFKNKLTLHLNSIVFWDYTGAYDEMGMYEQAYSNVDISSLDAATTLVYQQNNTQLENEKRLLEQENAYQTEIRLNASVSYAIEFNDKLKIKLSVFGENIIDNQKRYYVSTGSSASFPTRLKFVKEPRSFGVRLHFYLF